MENPAVLYDTQGGIGRLTLNRPENRNSMDAELLPAFREALARAQADRELRCLVITGTGKSFCAGADFKSALVDTEGRLPHEIFASLYEPFLAVGDVPVPTVAAMNGHAIGGGFGLALMCDLRVARRDARYGANFARLGIHPGMATTYLLPRLVGLPRACELLFSGRLFDGDEALSMGLVNDTVAEAEVLPRAMALAEEIAASAPAAVRMMKDTIYRHLDWDPRRAARYEAHCQSRTFEMDDAREGIAALLEKRKPDFKGR